MQQVDRRILSLKLALSSILEQSVQFHNLEPNSTEWKQVQFILATSILDQSFAVKNNWILESIQLVQNNKLLSEYR